MLICDFCGDSNDNVVEITMDDGRAFYICSQVHSIEEVWHWEPAQYHVPHDS